MLVEVGCRVVTHLCSQILQLVRADEGSAARAGCGKERAGCSLLTDIALQVGERDVEPSGSFRLAHAGIDGGYNARPQVGGVSLHPPACHPGSII